MDNKKIGDLIARLRKQKGLTQQELGDMVGVGFRSVSKWERGINLPDVSIINDVSKILGITSDELLSGELNEEVISNTKSKNNKKLKITIIVILSLLLISLSTYFYFKNKTYVYEMESIDDAYYVEGTVNFKNNKIIISLNKLKFKDEFINLTKITNYEYKLISNKKLLTGTGNIENTNLIDGVSTIGKINNSISIYYNEEMMLAKKSITSSGIVLNIIYLNLKEEKINVNIKIKLVEK